MSDGQQTVGQPIELEREDNQEQTTTVIPGGGGSLGGEPGGIGMVMVCSGVTPAQYEKNFTFVRCCHSQILMWKGCQCVREGVRGGESHTNTHSAKWYRNNKNNAHTFSIAGVDVGCAAAPATPTEATAKAAKCGGVKDKCPNHIACSLYFTSLQPFTLPPYHLRWTQRQKPKLKKKTKGKVLQCYFRLNIKCNWESE